MGCSNSQDGRNFLNMNNFFSIYSVIYIPIILSIFIQNIKTQRKFIIFWIIILVLFRGLRWECGTDWKWYLDSFDSVTISNFYNFELYTDGEQIKKLEPLWTLLMLLCKVLFGTYTSFLIISNLIILYIYYKLSTFFTKNSTVCFALLICEANFFPVRQDLAISFFALGVCWAIKNKNKLFVFNNIIAFFIHQSSIVLLPITFIIKKIRPKLYIYIIILCLGAIFSKYFTSIIIPLIINLISIVSPTIAMVVSIYSEIDKEIEGVSNPIASLILNISFITLFYITLIKRLKYIHLINEQEFNKQTCLFSLINIYFLNAFTNILFARTFPDIARMSSYFLFALPILFGVLIDNIKNNKIKIRLLLILLIYLSYRYIKHFSLYPELHFPYHSIFS